MEDEKIFVSKLWLTKIVLFLKQKTIGFNVFVCSNDQLFLLMHNVFNGTPHNNAIYGLALNRNSVLRSPHFGPTQLRRTLSGPRILWRDC